MPDILKELEPVFYPKSIAVIGASADESKNGSQFLGALRKAGYRGSLYGVGRGGGTSHGLPLYPDLRSVPGPVEYVIISVPREAVLEVIDDCAAKGVKAVQLFTAGFRESGTEIGRRLEAELVAKARQAGIRVIGPNCIGVYNPSMRISYGPLARVSAPGHIGFISQSGGHGGRLIEHGLDRGVNLSKLVSFGNGADLDSADFLEYFGADPETKIIGAYLEGLGRPRRFLALAREISPHKPIVIWKGGRTDVGAEAAASHTGALRSSYAVWQGAMRQASVIPAESIEDLADMFVALESIGPAPVRSVAVISGIGGGGGGESVLGSDAFAGAGFQVPRFSDATRRAIEVLLPAVGTILRNPLDLGGVTPRPAALESVIKLVFADERIDMVVVQEHFQRLLRNLTPARVREMNSVMISAWRAQSKPLAVVAPAWATTEASMEVERALREAGVAVFRSFDAAARSFARASAYLARRGPA